jgi:putative ABC transport system substrate-binding protein
MRRLGALFGGDENDSVAKDSFVWFRQGLEELGWTEGRNLRMDVRWAAGDPERMRAFAKELVDLSPDVIFVNTPAATKAVQRQTQVIPIVFSGVGDPVAGDLLKSVASPEGNSTGVTNYFPSFGSKWLELLKVAVPNLSRTALLFNPDISTGAYFANLDAAAPRLGVTIVRIPYRNVADLQHAIDAFAAEPDGGLIVLPPAPLAASRALINRLAVQHGLPIMAGNRAQAADGGLMSYGPNYPDLYRRTAGLRGPHPARRQGGGPNGSVPDQVRASSQSQDRQGDAPDTAGSLPRPRR